MTEFDVVNIGTLESIKAIWLDIFLTVVGQRCSQMGTRQKWIANYDKQN